ncbi:MAG: Hsp20/alpha crystallin family protein [Minisyncoccia bacterium]
MFGQKNKKQSFLEKLTGAVKLDEQDEVTTDEDSLELEDESGGQLAVDVYQTPKEIIIKTMVAGVKPEDLDVSITRDMVTIAGSRSAIDEVIDEDYFHQELYWGSFSRSIALPAEIDVDAAEAIQKQGLLVLRLPKIDRNKQNKVKVKGQ